MTNLDFLEGLPRVETALHGPAHPDEFRVKIGRFGDRFYHDPLPACDLAPACDDAWPSVTTVKKAAGKDWTWTSLERAAVYLEKRRDELAGMNAAEIHARLLDVNKAGLNRASDRGSSIHAVMEALAAGGELPNLSDEAKPYLPACRRFLDEAQPEWVMSEVVAISRTYGYGGTFDAVVRMNGGTYLVDWKTRKPGKHGAYEEEAWQLAAYARCDYIIVDRDGTAVRELMPPLDGAYVISLAPEGYRPYPVHLDESWQSYLSLKSFWSRKRMEHIGKPVRFTATATVTEPDPTTTLIQQTFANAPDPDVWPPPTPADPPADPALRAWIKGRLAILNHADHALAAQAMKARWPADIPGFKGDHVHTFHELQVIGQILDVVEAHFEIPFGEADPTIVRPEPKPEPPPLKPLVAEGPTVVRGVTMDLFARLDVLDDDVRTVIERWASEAHAAGHTFSIKLVASQRRAAIYEALLALVPLIDTTDERQDMVRATVALVVPDVGQLAIPIGVALGQLTIEEAEHLAELARVAATSSPTLAYTPDGAPRWLPAF